MTIYEATPEEREVATLWHGGMGSMFYAVSSTGALSRGTIRNGRSDEQWSYELVCQLTRELRETIPQAIRQGEDGDARVMIAWRVKMDALEDELAAAIDED